MRATPPATPAPLSLGGAFTVERAAELHALLGAQLQQSPPAALCLQDISEIDCAGLQLLLALKRQHPQLRLSNPSPAVAQLFERLRLTALLSV